MQAIEFEATAYPHSIKIPRTVPDGGVPMPVLLLLADTQPAPAPASDVKTLLASVDRYRSETGVLKLRSGLHQ